MSATFGETLSQGLTLQAPLAPQQLTSTSTVTAGPIDLGQVKRALFVFETGAFGGTSPTLSAALTITECATSGGSYTTNPNAPTPTVTAASKQVCIEIRADQLSAGMRFVKLNAVCTVGGTSPTIPVCALAIGGQSAQAPASQFDVASVTKNVT